MELCIKMANANEECIATQGKKTNFYQNKSQKVCQNMWIINFFTSALHLMHLINIHGTTLQDVHMHLGWGDFVDWYLRESYKT